MYAELERKICLICKEEKSLDLFRQRNDRKCKPIESYCKACERDKFKIWYSENKEYQKQRDFVRNCEKFGLSADRYNEMVENQKAKCAICLKPESSTRGGKIKNLAIDHCHETGQIRALLCNGCNTAIGLLKEDIETLEAALKYLKKFKK